jgi:hypothetical protein
MATELVRYDAMCQAIASAYRVDEVKDIRDRAAALEHYSRQAHNIEAERQCCEVRLRAERKAGQLLAKMDKAKGGARKGVGRRGGMPSDGPTPLSALGITRDQASQWQKLADVPDDQFEMALAGSDKPTTNGIIAAAAPPVITPVSDDALWLWGRLREFERHQVFDTEPARFVETMTPTMLDDVRALAPRVAQWLGLFGEV